MIDDLTKQKILDAANLVDVISDFQTLKKEGKDFSTKCTKCDKDHGLKVSPAKNIFKCFTCNNLSGNSAVSYLMEGQGMNYVDSLKYLAEKYHIDIEPPKPKAPAGKKKRKFSFCDQQLAESGLTVEDVIAKVNEDDDNKTRRQVQVMRSGSKDQYNQLVAGDDMIIYYYDLDGKPVMYQKPKSSRFEHLYRVRWQNPGIHLDKAGNPIKYQSPRGSGSHLYIPQRIRELYQHKRQFNRLFIQEGEKKAEKACKHGVHSVGIMGIHNLGQEGKMPHEMQLLVQACGIKEVVFLLDADWDHISQNISPGQRVDLRPLTFFNAVKKFKEYFKTFYNLNISLEIYFAYVKAGEANEKGIDDLLAGTLKTREDELKKDIDKAMNEPDGEGQYIQLHKITTLTDHKIMQYWDLDSAERFANRHKQILENIPEFSIGHHKWRFNNGKFESAQPLESDEVYWMEELIEGRNGRSRKTYQFDYENCYNFLRNRGFGRILMADGKFQLARTNGHVVKITEAYQIKDFVMQFTKEIAPKDVRNMLYRGGKMYLGPDSLSNIDFLNPEFEIADRNYQNLYFRNNAWKITADRIVETPLSELSHYVWQDKVNNFDATVLKEPLFTVINEDGRWDIEMPMGADKCHFLGFLYNTSNFFWKKQKRGEQLTEAEVEEVILALLAKITAIGYLLHAHKDMSQQKAVILMDGKLTEIGASNGRSGKSLLGKAIEQVVPTTYIPAKNKSITEDPFVFEEVTEKTEVVFLDDVRANLDFEFFFPLISGRLTINRKGDKKFTLSSELTPKLLLTTNHAINGEGSSFKDRQFLIAFSDHYHEDHKPTDDFEGLFFDEWDFEQWNLFYNLMAQCVQTYLKFGFIKPPEERLEKRRLRQAMGEVFLAWAEEYYSAGDKNLNPTTDWPEDCRLGKRISRKDLFDHYMDSAPPMEKRYTTTTVFKKKLKSFCDYFNLSFNPAQNGADDKSGGVEYFTVDNLKE